MAAARPGANASGYAPLVEVLTLIKPLLHRTPAALSERIHSKRPGVDLFHGRSDSPHWGKPSLRATNERLTGGVMFITVHPYHRCDDMNGYRQLDSSAVVAAGDHYELLAARCTACGHLAFPALTCCPQCADTRFTATTLPRQGTLYTYTTVHIGSAGAKVPYLAGYVDLDRDMRVFGHLEIDEAEVHIGMPLELNVRSSAGGRFEYAFSARGTAAVREGDA